MYGNIRKETRFIGKTYSTKKTKRNALLLVRPSFPFPIYIKRRLPTLALLSACPCYHAQGISLKSIPLADFPGHLSHWKP